ncbi:WAS/WASL-interacting protein family member 1-like [Chroicocephalus ridibundus]|uniref:WAS/WASL-interacting protein family member 1-like n=1 Tax=Chroicocephalus ridibundus TaxID=1192867 RepID=UPI002FDDF58E
MGSWGGGDRGGLGGLLGETGAYWEVGAAGGAERDPGLGSPPPLPPPSLSLCPPPCPPVCPPPAVSPGGPSGGPSPLERGLHAVVGTFYQYARAPGGGREPGLAPPDFQRLLRRELGHQLTDTGQPEAVAAIFALLDANGDRVISFAEYWQLVAWLCHVLRHRHYGAAPAPPPPPLCGDTPGHHPDPQPAPPAPAHGDGDGDGRH